MVLDLAIVAAALLGAFTGWRRGFLAPLITLAGAYLALSALYAGPGKDLLPSGIGALGAGIGVIAIAGTVLGSLSAILVSVLHKVPPLRALDHLAGIPLGAATALLAVYVALAAVLGFDNATAALHGTGAVDAAAAAAMKSAVYANPQYSALIDPAQLDMLTTAAASAAIPREQVKNASEALKTYEEKVRPQLIESRLGPILVAVGERIPFIGRHVDYPKE